MTKRGHFLIVCCIVIVAISAAWGLSFSAHLLNILVTLAAVTYLGVLTLLAFRLKPKYVAIPLGCTAIFTWLLLMLYLGCVTLFDGNSAVSVELDEGLHCEESVYGFVTSDSGEELTIYRRYLFIDRKIYHEVHSDVYPNEVQAIPASITNIVNRCHAQINKKRLATN